MSETSTVLLSNLRFALDTRKALSFHFEGHWPGASESKRST